MDANRSLYLAWQLACGVFVGLMQLTMLQRIRAGVVWYTVFWDIEWQAYLVAATLPLVYLLMKKRLLEREGAREATLGRPMMHIIGDFLFSAGAVSLFGIINYLTANDVALLNVLDRPSPQLYVVGLNIGLMGIG